MKHYLRLLLILSCSILAGGGFIGCSDSKGTDDPVIPDDPDVPVVVTPKMEVKVVSTGTTTVDLELTTEKITDYAYQAHAVKPETAPEAAVLFALGTTGKCTANTTTFTVKELQPGEKNYIYVAGLTDEETYYKEVILVEITTESFSDAVTVYDIAQRTAKVHVNVPADLKEKGNALKWRTVSLSTYNMYKKLQGMPDAESMNLSDEYYHQYITEDNTFILDEDHCYVLDEQGQPIYDEDSGEYRVHFYPPVPGQPQVFTLGEYAQGEHPWGFGTGYYAALFDTDAYYEALYGGGGGGFDPLSAPFRPMDEAGTVEEANYWTGFYHKSQFQFTNPTLLDGKFNITTNLRANGGVVSLNPDPSIKFYCVMIIDTDTFDNSIMPLLDNNTDYLQWFVTSFDAQMMTPVYQGEGPADLVLEDLFYVNQDMKFKVFAVGMGDDLGLSQCMETLEFGMPEPTLPAPVLEVKGIDNPEGPESPYEVWFNIKCTTQNAATAKYACNYERDWESMRKKGYSDADLIASSNAQFTPAEIAQINSTDGMNIKFSAREDSNTYFGALAANIEGTESEAVVASRRTIREPAAERVDSPLFEELKGDWTATATVFYTVTVWDSEKGQNVTETKTEQKSCKVTIGDVKSPATLPASVYALYPNMTKAEVDALYADLKQTEEIFNEKTRNQNRILCNGFDFEVGQYASSEPWLTYGSPYDLFVSSSYNAYNNEAVLYDFGPKWYFEIKKDGSVGVPFDTNYFAPLSDWWTDKNGYKQAYYLLGASDSHSLPYVNEGTGYFPAEVSADKNTITVKPLTYGEETYYPWAAYNYYGSWSANARIKSDITLTRGWTEPAAASKKNTSAAVQPARIASPQGMKFSPVQRPKSRTIFSGKEKVERKTVSYKIATSADIEANMKRYAKQLREQQINR